MSVSYKVRDTNFSVVLIGKFNNLHHLPDNLLQMGLINENDKENTDVEYVSPAELQISLPWGNLRTEPTRNTQNRLSIFLTDLSSITLFRDFVFSLLDYNDTANPTIMGINYKSWITHQTQEEWNNFGDALTPKSQWLDLFGKEDSRAGMTNISMRIESALEPVIENAEEQPQLNISILPVRGTKDKDYEFCTECILNYHFPLGKSGSMENAKITIEKYFDEIFKLGPQNIKGIVESFS